MAVVAIGLTRVGTAVGGLRVAVALGVAVGSGTVLQTLMCWERCSLYSYLHLTAAEACWAPEIQRMVMASDRTMTEKIDSFHIGYPLAAKQ